MTVILISKHSVKRFEMPDIKRDALENYCAEHCTECKFRTDIDCNEVPTDKKWCREQRMFAEVA